MNLKSMKVFVAVMRTGSLTEAAQRIGVSQPAASKLLRHLEDRFKFQLFRRERGRLIPTAEAHSLLPLTEAIFQNIDAVERIAQDLSNTLTGFIRVATIPGLGPTILPRAIASFKANRPGVRIGVKVLNVEQTIERVANLQVDLGVVYAPPDDPRVIVEPLTNVEIVCVLPAGHPLARLPKIDARAVMNYPLISVSRASAVGVLIDDAFSRVGVRRSSIVEVSHNFIAYSLVASGVGVAVVDPLLHHESYFPDVVVKPFRPKVVITPSVLYAAHRPLSRLSRAFIDRMHDELYPILPVRTHRSLVEDAST